MEATALWLQVEAFIHLLWMAWSHCLVVTQANSNKVYCTFFFCNKATLSYFFRFLWSSHYSSSTFWPTSFSKFLSRTQPIIPVMLAGITQLTLMAISSTITSLSLWIGITTLWSGLWCFLLSRHSVICLNVSICTLYWNYTSSRAWNDDWQN